jgi:hypothetical protein
MIYWKTIDKNLIKRIALLLAVLFLMLVVAECTDEADWEQCAPGIVLSITCTDL